MAQERLVWQVTCPDPNFVSESFDTYTEAFRYRKAINTYGVCPHADQHEIEQVVKVAPGRPRKDSVKLKDKLQSATP